MTKNDITESTKTLKWMTHIQDNYVEIEQLISKGRTHANIVYWLNEEKGIEVSLSTFRKCLYTTRERVENAGDSLTDFDSQYSKTTSSISGKDHEKPIKPKTPQAVMNIEEKQKAAARAFDKGLIRKETTTNNKGE